MDSSIRPLQPERTPEVPRLPGRRPREEKREPFELEDEAEKEGEREDEAARTPRAPANQEGVGRRIDFTA